MPRRKEPEPPWQIILEEIPSQNRSTIEGVETNRRALEERIDRFDADSRARDNVLELAVRDLAAGQRALRGDVDVLRIDVGALKIDLAAVQADVAGIRQELGVLTTKVDALGGLEPRIAALERRRP